MARTVLQGEQAAEPWRRFASHVARGASWSQWVTPVAGAYSGNSFKLCFRCL